MSEMEDNDPDEVLEEMRSRQAMTKLIEFKNCLWTNSKRETEKFLKTNRKYLLTLPIQKALMFLYHTVAQKSKEGYEGVLAKLDLTNEDHDYEISSFLQRVENWWSDLL